MKRRNLLTRVWGALGLGFGLAMLGELAPGAGAAAATLRLELASVAEVRRKGLLLFPATPMGPVALVWDQPRQQVVALDPRCPHRGCLVKLASKEPLLVCPCHRALFSQEGQWIGGQRRTSSLQRFDVAVQNGRVSVLG